MPSLAEIPHAIQLAIAPVFLLTGIASLLGVMTNRLARIIDRGRYFEQNWDRMSEERRAAAELELSNLERRRMLTSHAIRFSTLAALLVCLVIVVLFVQGLAGTTFGPVLAVLFVGAMLAVTLALVNFLREVRMATHSVRLDFHRPPIVGADDPPLQG